MKLQGLMFIDSHVHILPPKRLRGLVRWILRAYPGHPVKEEVTAQDILDDLSEQGVTHFFNFAYPLKEEETGPLNRFNLDFCRNTDGAIPFASLHQDTPDKAGVCEKAVSDGFVGLKFHPFVQKFDPWDARMDPVYSFMQEAGRPVVLHTGFEDFYNLEMPVSKLERLMERFPGLNMVFVHMAFPDLERAYDMLERFEGLYLDATNCLACLRPLFRPFLETMPEGPRLPDLMLEGIEKYRGRIMFGSDHPAGMGPLSEIYRDLFELPVSDDAKNGLQYLAAKGFVERFVPGFDWGPALAG